MTSQEILAPLFHRGSRQFEGPGSHPDQSRRVGRPVELYIRSWTGISTERLDGLDQTRRGSSILRPQSGARGEGNKRDCDNVSHLFPSNGNGTGTLLRDSEVAHTGENYTTTDLIPKW